VGDRAGQISQSVVLPSQGDLRKIQKDLITGGVTDEISNTECETIRKGLQKAMWKGIGIVRDSNGIEQVLSFIQKWEWVLKGTFKRQPEVELKNLLLLGQCISTAALLRKESVGAHCRMDSKPQDSIKEKHLSLQWIQSNCTVDVLKS